jgi:sugar lactone lactonase YvrE
MAAGTRAELAIACADAIGEAPVWDAAGDRLLWVDHALGVIHEAKARGALWRETRRWSLQRHLAAALPRAHGGLLVAGGLQVFTLDEVGNPTPFAAIDADPSQMRTNEAKCDAQGRLWVGTLSLKFRPGAALYRIEPDGVVTAVLQNVALANGFDWSPDGSKFYFIDTLTASIDVFDFDAAAGTITNRRSIVKIEWGAGGANGMTVDREGCLWVALTGGGEVRRYTPEGGLLERVTISIPGATSCAFGGPECTDLFITSRSGRMPEIALTIGVPAEKMESTGPEAGALFVCRPGVRGNPAHPFAG